MLEETWESFFSRQSLSLHEQQQFRTYYKLLLEANDIHNLTAITDLNRVIADHFEDSLALRKFYDCSAISMLSDIGTGAGFPAIPLKIVFPQIPMVLIEVSQKKREFLEDLIKNLELSDMEIQAYDWRTFLRRTSYPISLFCARASLQTEELMRMFKPSSPYKDAELVYWASCHWQPTSPVGQYIKQQHEYTVDDKKRKLIFFKGC
jgi:16S rRNA (guanine(527)-N(7))-methyltransferase RsmG